MGRFMDPGAIVTLGFVESAVKGSSSESQEKSVPSDLDNPESVDLFPEEGFQDRWYRECTGREFQTTIRCDLLHQGKRRSPPTSFPAF